MRHNNSTPIDRARRGLGIDSRRVGCLYIHSSANADGSGFGPLNPSVPADSRSSRTRAADHGPNHFFMARPAPFLPSEMKRLTELSAEGKEVSALTGSACIFTTGRRLSIQPDRFSLGCALLTAWSYDVCSPCFIDVRQHWRQRSTLEGFRAPR